MTGLAAPLQARTSQDAVEAATAARWRAEERSAAAEAASSGECEEMQAGRRRAEADTRAALQASCPVVARC